jgi:phage protein D
MAVAEKPITPCLLVGEGKTKQELGDALLELEVEEHHDLAGVFRIRLAIVREKDGLWTFLDKDMTKPFAAVEIKMNEELLIAGYVTQVRVHIDAAEGNSYLELVGMDTSCLMSAEEIIKDWPEKRDSAIATEIFEKYGLNVDGVKDTKVDHPEKMSTIIQRESDIQFLKRLARRNGFECVIEGKKAVFGKPDLTTPSLPVLAAHFDKETNLTSFDANWNALRPTGVEYHQIDTAAKQIQVVTVNRSAQKALGKDGAVAPKLPKGKRPNMFVRHHLTTGIPEAQNLVDAIVDEADWFIEVKGEVDTILYGALLHVRRKVPIKGVGELLSGLYYVTSVRHVYKVDNYIQHFTARRNATTSVPSDFAGKSLLPF